MNTSLFELVKDGWELKKSADYQQIVYEYAKDGWRLVQIFAPGIGAYGAAKYYEMIFERELK